MSRPTVLVSFALISTLFLHNSASSQSPPYGTISPPSGIYPAGTQLSVHIWFCSSGFFDSWGTVRLNGVTIGSTQPSSGSCSEVQEGNFLITVSEGDNTVTGDIADNNGTAHVEATYSTAPPPPPPPAMPPVVVPDGEKRMIAPGSGYSLSFDITNPDTQLRDYALSFTCTGAVTTCSGPPALSVSSGQTKTVWATLSVAGTQFVSGTLKLQATTQASPNPSDTGSYAITVAPGGPIVERDLCLTIAAGPGAAYECGDLRLIHALPATRTLNKARVPTLLYNSPIDDRSA